MKFEELINGKLWAVREDDSESHELEILLDHWNDVVWLREFFINNIDDINAHVTPHGCASTLSDYLPVHIS